MMFDLFDKGGIVMYPLLACSVISLTVVLERTLFWMRKKREKDTRLVHQVLELALEKEYLSYDFYKRASTLVNNPDSKALLNELALEERVHADILLREVSEAVNKK